MIKLCPGKAACFPSREKYPYWQCTQKGRFPISPVMTPGPSPNPHRIAPHNLIRLKLVRNCNQAHGEEATRIQQITARSK